MALIANLKNPKEKKKKKKTFQAKKAKISQWNFSWFAHNKISATEQKPVLGHTFRFHKSVSRPVNLKFQLKEDEIFILLFYSTTGISSNSINYWSI